MRKFTAVPALLVLVTTLIAACGGGDEEDPGNASGGGQESLTVVANDFYFGPTALAATPGQDLVLTVENAGVAEHTFTIDGLGIDETIAAGEEKAITVQSEDAGQFEFYCRYHHNQMTGTITIGEGSASAPTKDSDSNGGGGYGY